MSTRHALWLMPEGRDSLPYDGAISGLVKEYGIHAFKPHLTLLGGLTKEPGELHDACRALAASMDELKISLLAARFGQSYYRCLYLPARKNPALKAARDFAMGAFGVKPEDGDEDYMPHLSLMYAEPLTFGHEDKAGILKGLPPGLAPSAFTVRALWLYNIEGGPTDWRPVQRFQLATGDQANL